MKKVVTIFALLILTALLAYASSPFIKEVDARGITTLNVDNVNGFIKVSSWDKRVIHVEAVLKGTGEDVKEMKVQVEKKGETLEVSTHHGTHYFLGFIPLKRGGEVDYTIYVPENLTVNLDSVNGSIEVKGVRGGGHLETVNGRVRMKDSSGSIHIESVNGSLDVDVDDPAPQAHLETVNGAVNMVLAKDAGCTYHLETVNGTVNFREKEVQVSGAGPKEVKGTLGDGRGKVHIEVINGTITLSLSSSER